MRTSSGSDALQLGGEAGRIEQRALDVGGALDPLGGNRPCDGDDRVASAHRLGDDVAAGVAGSSDDGDACHGVPFDGVVGSKAHAR